MELNPTQSKLWQFLSERGGDLTGLSLRDIGEKIGVGRRAQLVAHHLEQLEKKGLIKADHFKKGVFSVYQEPTPNAVYVPLYECTAQCGPDGFFGNDNVVEQVALSPKTFRISDPKQYFLVRARGESMEPRIHSGDLVLARKQDDVPNGSLAVVVHEEMPKIKQVVYHTSGRNKMPVLVSLNPNFENQVVSDENEQLRIVGEVRGVIRLDPFTTQPA